MTTRLIRLLSLLVLNIVCTMAQSIELDGRTAVDDGVYCELVSLLDFAASPPNYRCSLHLPFGLTVVQVLNKLVELVNRPDAKDEDSLLVTENAVAAIGTLCVSPTLSTRVDRSRLLALWLSNLPIKEVCLVEATSTFVV